MSPCFNYRLTTPPHTGDKPPDLKLWNLIPFFKKSSCTDAGCTGRDETAVCNISQACSIGFRSGDLAGHSIYTDDCGLFEILIGDAGSMCTRIVIHQNEIFTNSTCIWANVNIQDLVYVPESRQRAVVNDVEVRFPLSTYSRPNHESSVNRTGAQSFWIQVT